MFSKAMVIIQESYPLKSAHSQQSNLDKGFKLLIIYTKLEQVTCICIHIELVNGAYSLAMENWYSLNLTFF